MYGIPYMGSKKRELPLILDNLPAYNRFLEPFVGGGNVLFNVPGKKN